MRTPAIAALTIMLAVPTAASTQALAGGWRDCPRPAYYSAPVPVYRYDYRPVTVYQYPYFQPGLRAFYAPPRHFYYGYRRGGFHAGYGWGGWGRRGFAFGIGF